MADPFIGEIRMFGGNFAPCGWAFCNGQLMSIAENDVLYSLLGTTYGGDGVNSFGLPDLRSRLPIHVSSNNPLGQMLGSESVTIDISTLPSHSHPATAQGGNGTSPSPAGTIWASDASGDTKYGSSLLGSQVMMNGGALSSIGGSQPHDNIQPYLAVSFIIALEGIYPSQS